MEDPQPEMINVIGAKQGLISYSTDVKRYASPHPSPAKEFEDQFIDSSLP